MAWPGHSKLIPRRLLQQLRVDTLPSCYGATVYDTAMQESVWVYRDHLAHPLYGEQKRSNGLLLRLTQPRASTDGSAGPEQPTVRAEVLARVTSSYR